MNLARPHIGRDRPTRDLEILHGHPQRAVVGIDEVGLAPLAGPVVACAVLMPAGVQIDGVADSKALTPRQRERAAVAIRAAAVAIGVGAASTREVEALNPRAASHLAMQRAWPNWFTAAVPRSISRSSTDRRHENSRILSAPMPRSFAAT